jgi:hypothetical protein
MEPAIVLTWKEEVRKTVTLILDLVVRPQVPIAVPLTAPERIGT